MANDGQEATNFGKPFRLRFSLLALLIFITLVCFLLAWLVQQKRVVATALFEVGSTQDGILSDEPAKRPNDQEFDILKKTQLAKLKSNFVLTAALRNPGIASLPILRAQKDPVDWLQDRLEVDFPENAEILAIRLHGTEEQAEDLIRIVDAVAAAYQREVIFELRQRRLGTRDMLARNLEDLNHEIKHKLDQYLDIARESGGVESGSGQVLQELDLKRLDRIETELMRLEGEQVEAQTGSQADKLKSLEARIEQLHKRQEELQKTIVSRSEKSVDLTTRHQELERQQRIADEMAVKLERLDIEANSPDRIRQVQPAVISAE